LYINLIKMSIVKIVCSDALVWRSQGDNCLLTQAPQYIMADDKYPGREFTVDEQCQDLYGDESFFCAVSHH